MNTARDGKRKSDRRGEDRSGDGVETEGTGIGRRERKNRRERVKEDAEENAVLSVAILTQIEKLINSNDCLSSMCQRQLRFLLSSQNKRQIA